MPKEPVEIRQIRNSLKMSQSQFSEYFHINISTLQMWEQGINNTSQTVLHLVKKILELEGRPSVPEAKTEAESANANEG